MKFVHPEFLWAFAVLAIPVIIHLFNFRKYKVLYFPSLSFLKFVDQQTRSTQKLKHYLVLALRLLAFSLLIFAFAQPFIPAESSTKGGKPVIALYLDNSFSMTAKGTEGELISEARELARKIINDAPLSTGILLHTNQLNGIEKRILTKVEALDYLDKIVPGPMVRQLEDIISWQQGVLDKENETGRKIGTRQYIYLSDFQKNTSKADAFKADPSNFYYPIKLTPQEQSNLFIDSIWFSSPVHKVGSSKELSIRLINESEEDLTNVEVKFTLDKVQRDVFVDVPAKDKTITTINYTEKTKGYKNGKITVNDKQLFWDDDYYFSYFVDQKLDILIINGEDASQTVEQIYSLEAFYTVKAIPQGSFTLDALNGVELVVLNGVNEIPSGLSENLVSFAESSGSIALFPGKKIDSQSANSFLTKIQLPALGRTIAQGTKIRKVIYEDPFFLGMFDKEKEELNLPAITQAYSVANSSSAKYLDLITMQNGQPLLMRSNNAFNAYLFASSLDQSFGNFTSESLYPAVLLRMAELSQRSGPIALTIGKDAFYPLFEKPATENPVHLKSKKVDFIPRIEKRGLISYLILNGAEAIENLPAGNYDLVDDDKQGVVSLNYNRSESSVEYASSSEIETSMKEAGIENVSSKEITQGQSLAKIDIEKPFEYWRLCVILALVFLLGEMVVLKFLK
ncbi:MAG: BatA domain-containing protein [Crocinitomicaceae bacterium]|nr:BatA domain-containing protein [Crocinitomicaceae bacterium]